MEVYVVVAGYKGKPPYVAGAYQKLDDAILAVRENHTGARMDEDRTAHSTAVAVFEWVNWEFQIFMEEIK